MYMASHATVDCHLSGARLLHHLYVRYFLLKIHLSLPPYPLSRPNTIDLSAAAPWRRAVSERHIWRCGSKRRPPREALEGCIRCFCEDQWQRWSPTRTITAGRYMLPEHFALPTDCHTEVAHRSISARPTVLNDFLALYSG